MNTQYFAYRRGDIITAPNTKNLEKLTENMVKVVVAIVGNYNSMASGLNLGLSEIMAYHSKEFHPKEALIGDKVSVPIKEIRRISKHYTYETLTQLNKSIIGITDKIEPDDLVFQVGVRENLPSTISFGVVDRINKYVEESRLDDFFINDTSESGSGVFTQDGKLLGMTLGVLSPQVMVASSISSIILRDRPLPSEQKPWFYSKESI